MLSTSQNYKNYEEDHLRKCCRFFSFKRKRTTVENLLYGKSYFDSHFSRVSIIISKHTSFKSATEQLIKVLDKRFVARYFYPDKSVPTKIDVIDLTIPPATKQIVHIKEFSKIFSFSLLRRILTNSKGVQLLNVDGKMNVEV